MTNKEKIKNIIKDAKNLQSYQEKIDFLHNKFTNQTCYILGCGPSILHAPPQKLKFELENNLCLSIKAIYFSFKDIVDFHFFNCNNFINYPYSEQTFIVSQSDFCDEITAKQHFWGPQQYDLGFIIDRQPKENTLSRTKAFDQWLISNSGVQRPWGPGIMYESVLFFAHHLGCKQIRTIGWDYKDPNDNSNIQHFYEESIRINNFRNPAAQPYAGEILETINLASDWKAYINKHGRDIKVYNSNKCYIHKDLERFSL